jgi:hypothetical protein
MANETFEFEGSKVALIKDSTGLSNRVRVGIQTPDGQNHIFAAEFTDEKQARQKACEWVMIQRLRPTERPVKTIQRGGYMPPAPVDPQLDREREKREALRKLRETKKTRFVWAWEHASL